MAVTPGGNDDGFLIVNAVLALSETARLLRTLEWDSFEKARLLEMSKALPCRLWVPITVEHIAQVIGVDDPERPDRCERLALLSVQLIGSLPVAHELAGWATWQVDLASEATPAVIVAVAAASRSTMAFE
jgi:hypothetical protein